MPKEGVPNRDLAEPDHRNLARRNFASYIVEPEASQTITEMKALGIEPMTLRSVLRKTPR